MDRRHSVTYPIASVLDELGDMGEENGTVLRQLSRICVKHSISPPYALCGYPATHHVKIGHKIVGLCNLHYFWWHWWDADEGERAS